MKPPRVHVPEAQTFTLEAAILVYGARHGGAYISRHGIEKGRSGLHLGAGQPLEQGDLLTLLARAGRDVGVRGWIAPRILYVAPRAIAWWRPAAPAPMFFNAGSIDKRARQGTAPQPSLVFAVTSSRRWHVWAVGGDERPHAGTRLMQAPYPNVYEDGQVCQGNVDLPKVLAPSTIEGFERGFFESRFTHANAGRLCLHKDGHQGMWRDLLAAPAGGRFPDACLLPTDTNLGDAMRMVADSKEIDDAL